MWTSSRARAVGAVVAATCLLAACSDTSVRSRWTNSETGETVEASSGSRHCDWSSMTFIELPGGQFAADPEGLIPAEWREAEHVEDAPLPGGAIETGFASGDERIWYAPDETAIYVGLPDSADQWPRIVPGFGCD